MSQCNEVKLEKTLCQYTQNGWNKSWHWKAAALAAQISIGYCRFQRKLLFAFAFRASSFDCLKNVFCNFAKIEKTSLADNFLSIFKKDRICSKNTQNTIPPPSRCYPPLWTWLYVQNGSTLLQIALPKLCSPFPLSVIIVFLQMPNLLLMILWEASLSFWKDFVNWSCL